MAGAQQAEREFGVRMQFIPDVVAENTIEEAWTLARWAVAQQGNGVCALGLAGREVGRDEAALAPDLHLCRATRACRARCTPAKPLDRKASGTR